LVALRVYDMSAARSGPPDAVPGQSAPDGQLAAPAHPHIALAGAAPEPDSPAVSDESELAAAELETLSAAEEEALYGAGAGRAGGARGDEDAFRSYLHDIRGLALLSPQEERLVAQRAAAGDARARRRLVEANLRLVIAIARAYARAGVPLVDLIQEGNLGLLRAAEKFDWRRGTRFGTYAGWWIRQAVSRAAGEQARLIHLPERVVVRLHRVRRAAARLAQERGAEPSAEQIAQAADVPLEEVNDLLSLVEQPSSLDAALGTDEHRPLADVLEDSDAEAPAEVASQHLLSEDLHQALARLPQRERSVVMLRFGIGDGCMRTLREVGKELNISRERVRQIEERALASLRSASAVRSLRDTTYPTARRAAI
jgi:RNA polymerase primary sigma factor